MKESKPPKLFHRFFRWFCHPKLRDSIEGDLIELYNERVKEKGKRKADLKFIGDVLLLFRPGIIKPTKGFKNLNNYGMLKSYFKIGWRNLLHNKGYAAINIAGLTLGISCSLILFMIVIKGNSYDVFHSKVNRIYRAVTKSKGNEGFAYTQGTPVELPDALRADVHQIENVAFTSYRRNSLITVYSNAQIKKYDEPKGVVFTEPSFFKIFDRKILIGSSESLGAPHEAIISTKSALKYFGKTDPVGETVEYDNVQYKISAVMEDHPDNTDLPFDLMLSYATIKRLTTQSGWGGIADSDNCYFLLKENQSVTSVEKQIPGLVKKYLGDDPSKAEIVFVMQPLRDIHSNPRFGNNNIRLFAGAKITFIAMAIFLLVTACINFVNLTTAEAIKRTREVGVRKVLGSSRLQLIGQVLIESWMITVISILLSLTFLPIAIGFLNPVMDFPISTNLLLDKQMVLILAAILFGITILSGLYPAWMVSGFKPILALKNQMSSNKGSFGYSLRKSLIVFQFFISQFFLTVTIITTQQLDFLQSHETGFSKDAIITLPIPKQPITLQARGSRIHSLKNEILQLPNVEKASLNSSPPSNNSVLGSDFTLIGGTEHYSTQIKEVDGDYIQLFDIKLLAGELLPELDSGTSIVVNEKLARTAGFISPGEIVGREIYFWDEKMTVKGVVKDFNTQALGKAIEPVILINEVSGYQSLSVKIRPTNMQETIEQVEKKWQEKYPEFVFSYSFVDEQIKNLYRGERKMALLVNLFTIITIIIGCLGLLGLVAFITNRKTKEIGVRKVLGASVESIVLLFSKEFGKLILIGFALSAPLAGYAMNTMLQEFAYRITLGPTVFFASLFASSMIVFLTVGYRTFKAAVDNPIKSLRSE